jgi:hypothetical protein
MPFKTASPFAPKLCLVKQFRPAPIGPAQKQLHPSRPNCALPFRPPFAPASPFVPRPAPPRPAPRPAPPAFSSHLQYHSGIPRCRPRLGYHSGISAPSSFARPSSFTRPCKQLRQMRPLSVLPNPAAACPSFARRPLRPPAAPRPQLRPPPNAQLRRQTSSVPRPNAQLRRRP